jgi:bacterioferritin-associated ferredoxin
MFVCICQAVTEGDLYDAIEAGAQDLDELADRCGAGASCGGCVPVLEHLLRQSRTCAA